jgi:hypothetical protein
LIPTTDATKTGNLAELSDHEPGSSENTNAGKKKFIEPELSAPISVAEATKFFQGTTSGGGI